MVERFRLTLAQLDPTVGALAANAAKARAAWEAGRDAGADLVALPEMFLTGYQLQDLVRRPAFLRDSDAALMALAAEVADGPPLAIGAPALVEGKLYNSYSVLSGGKVAARILKHHLPNDEVFDEYRYFTPGPISGPYRIGPLRIGSPICEDAWYPDVAEALEESGAQILLVPNGSPYARDKMDRRMNHMVARVVETGLPLVYLNLVGGQDDQVFDGGSFVLNPGGALAVQMPAFDECIEHVDFEETEAGWRAVPGKRVHWPDIWEQDYHAMVIGLRDYCRKTGFGKVLLGMSGGIDSALVAAIATDALGAANVRLVRLPSRHSSQHSLDDAAGAAALLGLRCDTIPIEASHAAVLETLAPLFEGTSPDITEENVQARLRGVLLMALSNKFGEMLLTTGNKSEVAVGYSTIYGDMAGGYNPIKDLYKTRVFETSRWRNENHRDWMMGPQGRVIPQSIIEKPPSAELRPDQKDEDSLPPYDVLDDILEALIDKEESIAEIVAKGHDRALVERIEGLILINEYKRFQSAPGTRFSQKAFWLDRRYPIVNRWRDRG